MHIYLILFIKRRSEFAAHLKKHNIDIAHVDIDAIQLVKRCDTNAMDGITTAS